MPGDLERRRVLFLADPLLGAILRQSIAPVLQEHAWELLEAENVERAQWALRYFQCDALLVDEAFYRTEGADGIAWLAAQRAAPVVLLADWDAELVATALDRGVQHWLPRTQALYQPRTLMSFLERAAATGDLRRQLGRLGEAYADRQRQVRELMERLAELLPLGQRSWWLPYRLLTGRLTEELERARRYQIPLSLVLGEVLLRVDAAHVSPAGPPLGKWVAEQLDRAKRLTDVGGDLGPGKFVLLLSHTLRTGAVACCRRLKANLEEGETVPAEMRPRLRIAFGVVTSPKGAREAEELLQKAEKCLARARRGENDGVVAL